MSGHARARLAAAALASLAAAAAPAQEPALDYLQHCAGCHMDDGAGSARNGVPDMRGSIGHFTRTEDGRAFLIQVAGVAQAPLPAADLAALVNWMLPAFSADTLPADFEPYSAREVEALRSARPADIAAARAHVAARLAAMGHTVADY